MTTGEVKKEKVETGVGIKFTKPESETKPPFAGREAEELGQALPPREPGAGIGPEERIVKAGKVPLHPAMVRLPLRAEGVILAEWTGYPDWAYDEATLNDMGEMAQQLDIMLGPAMQFAVAIVAIHAIKAIGYYGWVKSGKPKLHKVGEAYEKPEGEE